MIALLDWTLWWPLAGLLAVEAAALVVLAAILDRWVVSAAWRRTLWQACIVSLLVLLALEMTGAGRVLLSKNPEDSSSRVESSVRSLPVEPTLDVRHQNDPAFRSSSLPTPSLGRLATAPGEFALDAESGLPPLAPRDAAASSSESAGQLAGWFVLLWLVGALIVFGRVAMVQLLFIWSQRGSKAVDGPELQERVRVLTRRLGLRRTVRLIQSPRLAGPIAFGVMRPVVGLPPDFASDHRPEQQDVMLAHELAHLSAGDPVWHRLADLTSALLWWHPGVWWARRQLHSASEIAADEASLLVANGPGVLAECLVALGARMVEPRTVGGIGIEGSRYRSNLGRRVHRLVNLGGRAWCPPGWGAVTLARILGPVTLVLTLTVCAGWAFPDTSNKGATMKHWQQALGVLTMAATFSAEQTVLSAEPPVKVTTKPDVNIVIAAEPIPTLPATIKVAAVEIPSVEKRGAQALREKLERITLKEVTYDALPLNDVVEDLIRKSAEIDPEKAGVNFLFGQERGPAAPPAIDPATGLPVVPPPQEEFDLRSVTIAIRPPLKNLRLIDALEAIAKVADRPIKYSIEEYAVVFTRDGGATPSAAMPSSQVFATPVVPPVPPVPASPPMSGGPLLTRAFKINTNTFFASIERMFRIRMAPDSEDAGARLQGEVLPKAGARLTSPEALVLYNHLTGVLLVRASVEELETVQAAVETLGGAATGAAVKPSGSSSFLKHLAEGPHTHVHRAVTGVFDALSHLAPPPFNPSSR